jgi:hypothetical protein
LKLNQHAHHERIGTVDIQTAPEDCDGLNPNWWMSGGVDEEAREAAEEILKPILEKLYMVASNSYGVVIEKIKGKKQTEIAAELNLSTPAIQFRYDGGVTLMKFIMMNPDLSAPSSDLEIELAPFRKQLSTKRIDGLDFLLEYWDTWSLTKAAAKVGTKQTNGSCVLRTIMKKLGAIRPDLVEKIAVINVAYKDKHNSSSKVN